MYLLTNCPKRNRAYAPCSTSSSDIMLPNSSFNCSTDKFFSFSNFVTSLTCSDSNSSSSICFFSSIVAIAALYCSMASSVCLNSSSIFSLFVLLCLLSIPALLVCVIFMDCPFNAIICQNRNVYSLDNKKERNKSALSYGHRPFEDISLTAS